MKKLGLLLLAVAMLGLLTAACAPPTPEKVVETVVVTKVVEKPVEVTKVVEVEKKGPVTIGYAAPSLVGGQLDIQNSLVIRAKEKGWAVVTTNANGDPKAQNDNIDYYISLGVDAIVAVPEDSAGICAAVAKAKAAKIPFYTIDRSPIGCAINMTVLADNRMAGQQGGQGMVDLLTKKYGEPKGKVLEITGNLGQNVGMLRRDGFHDIVDKYPNIKVIQKVADWDAARGQSIAIDVLTANPDLDGIYLHSDNVYGAGTEAAMKQLGKFFPRGEKGHIFITAVDGGPWMLDAIRRGVTDAAASQPINDFGIAVRWIEQELKGQPVKEGDVIEKDVLWSPAKIKINPDGTPELFLATTLVTPDNVDDPRLYGNVALK